MEEFQVVVIGAGIIGLSIASELDAYNSLLVEQHPAFGQETSSRNSEVIHSGIYYTPDSLKARLCVQGKYLLYELCKKNNIPYKNVGKFIVAVSDVEVSFLENLHKQGLENGVTDLTIIDSAHLSKCEPEVMGLYALDSPSTGIVDVHSLMKYFETKAAQQNCMLAYGCSVIAIEKKQQHYIITIRDTDNDTTLIKTNVVINAAGLNSVSIAQLAGINHYKLYLCKGEYFSVSNSAVKTISRLIYPCPTSYSLGIHTVLDLNGNVKLGPNAFYTDTIDYQVDHNHKDEFFTSAQTYLKSIKKTDLTPDMSGIRPKIQAPGEPAADFVITMEHKAGFSGFINLIGLESPGLTSAPAIAKYVKNIVNNYLI